MRQGGDCTGLCWMRAVCTIGDDCARLTYPLEVIDYCTWQHIKNTLVIIINWCITATNAMKLKIIEISLLELRNV